MLASAALVLSLLGVAVSHPMPKPHYFEAKKVHNSGKYADYGAAVSVVPTVINSGDFVNVTITGGPAGSGDVIGLYAPCSYATDDSAHAVVDWFVISEQVPTYTKTGDATLYFRMINMRTDACFGLYTSLNNPDTIAISNSVTFQNLNQPRAARLANTANLDEMTITWTSAYANYTPYVKYWPVGSPSQYVIVNATTNTYNISDMSGPTANATGYRDPGIINTALLSGLTPGQAYTYIAGDSTGLINATNFVAPQPPNTFPYTMVFIADMGQTSLDHADVIYDFTTTSNLTYLLAKEIANPVGPGQEVRAIIHAGDVSYARGYQSEWDGFLSQISEFNSIANVVPYMVTLGNHEYDQPMYNTLNQTNPWLSCDDSEGEGGVPAAMLFPNMGIDIQALRNQEVFYVTYTGPIAHLVFSSEVDPSPSGKLYSWMQNTLASIDRTTYPWLFVSFHRPMVLNSDNFENGTGDQFVGQIMMKNLHDMMIQYDVDLVLTGHHHSTQASCAIYTNYTCSKHATTSDKVNFVMNFDGTSQKTPIHLVLGSGGAGYSTNWETPTPEYTDFFGNVHGYNRITVWNASSLLLEALDDGNNNAVFYSLTVNK